MSAREVAAAVVDPELPMLTLADLGVLRDVRDRDGVVTVTITPTYSGCPAMGAIRDDLTRTLHEAGFPEVVVRLSLTPPWSSDWISPSGRAALAGAGISPPGPANSSTTPPAGPVGLDLGPTRRAIDCPRCGSPTDGTGVELISEFGATACRALYRCTDCGEPFEHMKEI